MADLTGFRQMLADRAEADKGLPSVCLKVSSDFDMELARLVTVDNRQEDETDAQVASRYTDEICEALGKPENEGVAKKIGVVITAFKDKICAATKSLGEIRASARELAGFMDTGKNDLLAKDPFVSTHLNLTKLSVDYPTWEWNGPKVVGSASYIKERVGAKIVAKDADVPEDFDYRLFLQACTTIEYKCPFKTATLSDDNRATLIDQFVEALGEAVTKEGVTEVVDAMINPDKVKGMLRSLKHLNNINQGELFNTIKDYDNFIQKFYPVIEAIGNEAVVLPDGEAKDDLRANAESLQVLCEFLTYFELMERETVFRQSILLQGGLLNSDEKSAFEEAGGTSLMIAHYIRYMYKDDVTKIPARGISSKVIIESAAHNEKVVKADMSNVTNRIAIATTTASVTSFTTVAHRYIVNKIDRENPDAVASQKTILVERYMIGLVKKIASRILHHNIAFVDAALMLIVELDYHGTFVEQMYNELGTAYLAKAQEAEGGQVSDLDLQVAEMGVVAKMVANFIVEHIIEVCPCKDMTNKSPVVPENAGAN